MQLRVSLSNLQTQTGPWSQRSQLVCSVPLPRMPASLFVFFSFTTFTEGTLAKHWSRH